MQRLQPINVGQQANDRSGDPLRDGMVKVNENFAKVEAAVDKVEATAAGAQQRADAAHDKAVGANAAAATADGKAVAAAQSAAAGLAAAAAADGKAVAAQAAADEADRKAVAANAAAATAAQSAASTWRQPARPTGRRLPPMRPPWSRTARLSRPRKPPPWPRPLPMRRIKGASEDSLSYAGIQSGVATLEGRLATLADAQIPHVTTATVWDDANWNELPKRARNDGLVMRLIRSGGSSQNGPPAGQYYYVRHHWFSDRDTLTQIAIPYYNSEEITPGFQYRMKYEGVWTRWYSADPQTKARAFGVDQTAVYLLGRGSQK